MEEVGGMRCRGLKGGFLAAMKASVGAKLWNPGNW